MADPKSSFQWLLPLPIAWRLLPIIAIMATYCLALNFLPFSEHWAPPDWGREGSAATGIILGVLLVFRNNTAYERWWEGRKLWGQLVNDSRNLMLKTTIMIHSDLAGQREMARLLTAFCTSLKDHLRGRSHLRDLPGFDLETENPNHVPQFLAGRVFQLLEGWLQAGKLDSAKVWLLDQHARGLMDVCGACERIRHTPLPLSYRALFRHGIVIYMLVTPIYVVPNLQLWSIPVICFLTYFLVGIELLAEEVEEPFGRSSDNLPLERYCDTIAASIREIVPR